MALLPWVRVISVEQIFSSTIFFLLKFIIKKILQKTVKLIKEYSTENGVFEDKSMRKVFSKNVELTLGCMEINNGPMTIKYHILNVLEVKDMKKMGDMCNLI